MIALVLLVIFFSISSTLILKSLSLESTKTGFAPTSDTASDVAKKKMLEL